jgi:hypothetical protein
MNLIISIIIATVAIAAMMAIRTIAFDSALKERLKASRSGSACDAAPCLHPCGSGKLDAAGKPVPNGKNTKRSVPHAS